MIYACKNSRSFNKRMGEEKDKNISMKNRFGAIVRIRLFVRCVLDVYGDYYEEKSQREKERRREREDIQKYK